MSRKKLLSSAEINDILNEIKESYPKHLNNELHDNFIKNTNEMIRKELKKIPFYKENIPQLKEKIEEYMHQSIIKPAESVGVICAQSIGERQTQLTLNSFHQSGLAVTTVVTGVPRFLEILNATKEPKSSSMSFELNEDYKDIKDVRDIIKDSLLYIEWKDLILFDSLEFDKEEEPWYDVYEMLYSNEFRYYTTCISYKLKKEVMYEYSIYPWTIKEKLENEFEDIVVVFSPLQYGQIDIYFDSSNMTYENSLLEYDENTLINVFVEEVLKPKLEQVVICGIPKITNFFITKNQKTNNIKVETEGCNIFEFFKLPFIKQSSITTNHMWEVYEIAGIEGVRKFLIDELQSIVSSDGTYINSCHLVLLADLMTFYGNIHSISRYGVKKDLSSVLTRSSFEESLDHFSKAAFFSEIEKLTSVSASVMCGKRSKIGTGQSSVFVDWEKIKEM